MKKNKIFYIVLLTLSLNFLSSCYVNRPIALNTSEYDYNDRTEVRKVKFIKRKTSIGMAVNLGIVGAGGYAGYAISPFKYSSNNEMKSNVAANVAAGALVGTGVVLLTDWIMGKDQISEVHNYQDWINKAASDHILLRSYHDSLLLIKRSIETDYTVKNIRDVEDFKIAFSNSNREAAIFEEAITSLSRYELPRLIELYADNQNIVKAKEEYISSSEDMDSLKYALKKYGDMERLAEITAVKLVRSKADVDFFTDTWKNSQYNDSVIYYSSQYVPRNELLHVISKFPNNNIQILETSYIINSNNLKEYLDAIGKFKQHELSYSKKFDISVLEDAKSLARFINSKADHFGDYNASNIIYSIKKSYLDNEIIRYKKLSASDVEKNLKVIKNDTWFNLTEMIYDTQNQQTYDQFFAQYVKDLKDVEAARKRRNELNLIGPNDINSLINFASKYSGTPEAKEAGNTLNGFIKKYVTFEAEAAWFAKGDRNWLNDLYEKSRDIISGGNKYNYLVLGVIKNNSDHKIKIEIRGKLYAYYSCGVSLLRKRSTKSFFDSQFFELAPGEAVPYSLVYSGISEGVSVGSGLLTSGCSYIGEDHEKEVFFYSAEISKTTMQSQYKRAELIWTNENIDRKMESSSDRINRLFTGKDYTEDSPNVINSIVRVYLPTQHDSYTLTLMDGNKTVEQKNGSGGRNVDLYPSESNKTYTLLISGYNPISVFVKGRYTQVRVKNNGDVNVTYDMH